MNWLAHLVLSEPTPAFKVGNLLADLLPISQIRALPAAYLAGVARHREIDAFTDSHAIFKQSIARLDPRFRRFGGVITDIFYDHLLTAQWASHASDDLHAFVEEFHRDVETCRSDIPNDAYLILRRMRSGEWLTSYGDIDGVRLTLSRIGKRLRRPFPLGDAADELSRQYAGLEQDFATFFPLIRGRFTAEGTNSASLNPASHSA